MSSPAFPIPERLNLALAGAAGAAALLCLWGAAHAANGWLIALAVFVFSFVNNTLFSLLHEAVHGHFHSRRRVNEAAGILLAAFFPTILAVQRISHLGHHRRNRTDEELYDCYLPHQSWLLKTYWIYCLLFGFYWAIIPVSLMIYLVCPWLFSARWFQQGPARLYGFEPFVRDIAASPIKPIWLQGLFALAFQISVFLILDLHILAWVLCYWAFGLHWSSVQYTDHAGAPRDVVEGAWNLKFGPVSEALFLNYNYHLAHHREPGIPWNHLPKRVRPDDARPSFWPIYFRLFLGARPAAEGPSPDPLDISLRTRR